MKQYKKICISIFYETLPHLIACSILSVFNPRQAGFIFLIGLFFPDCIILIYKISPKLKYKKIEKTVNVFHIATILISIIALFFGYPLVFLAGMSHVALDLVGL